MEMAFDGDPLTCYASANLNNAWVGLDFGKKTEINKICQKGRPFLTE